MIKSKVDLRIMRRRQLAKKVSQIICKCYPKYNNYCSAKTTKVYGPWLDNPAAFVHYLMTLQGWENSSLWLDRIDSNGHYAPGNLRFVTPRINAFNRRDRLDYTPMTVEQIEEELIMSPILEQSKDRQEIHTLRKRINIEHEEMQKLRKSLLLTQQEVADEVGVTQPVISCIENGNWSGRSLSVLRKLFEVYDRLKEFNDAESAAVRAHNGAQND